MIIISGYKNLVQENREKIQSILCDTVVCSFIKISLPNCTDC